MPTYDYECDACQHKLEAFQKFSEPHLTKCPKCKKNKLRRLMGAGAALVFKGSGFYITDYRSDSYKKGADADKAPAAASESKSGDSKSSDYSSGSSSASSKPAAESKPATKSDSGSKKSKSSE